MEGGDREKRIGALVSGVKEIKLVGMASIGTKLKEKNMARQPQVPLRKNLTLINTHTRILE